MPFSSFQRSAAGTFLLGAALAVSPSDALAQSHHVFPGTRLDCTIEVSGGAVTDVHVQAIDRNGVKGNDTWKSQNGTQSYTLNTIVSDEQGSVVVDTTATTTAKRYCTDDLGGVFAYGRLNGLPLVDIKAPSMMRSIEWPTTFSQIHSINANNIVSVYYDGKDPQAKIGVGLYLRDPTTGAIQPSFKFVDIQKGGTATLNLVDLFGVSAIHKAGFGVVDAFTQDRTSILEDSIYVNQEIKGAGWGAINSSMPLHEQARKLNIPITDGSLSYITIINGVKQNRVTPPDATVYLRAFDKDGALLGYRVQTIKSMTKYMEVANNIFQGLPDIDKKMKVIQIDSTEPLIAQQWYLTLNPSAASFTFDAQPFGTTLNYGGTLESTGDKHNLRNPGSRLETVVADGYDANNKVLATNQFTLAAGQSLDKTNTELFNNTNVKRVVFKVQQPATNDLLDFSQAHIAGTSYSTAQQTWFNMTNADNLAISMDSNYYIPGCPKDMPRTGEDRIKYNMAPTTYRFVAIGNTAITSATLKPTTGAHNATWSQAAPRRLLSTTATTDTGITPANFPSRVAWGNDFDRTYSAPITVQTANGSIKMTLPLAIASERDYFVDGEFPTTPKASYNAIKNDINGIANIFYRNRGAFESTNLQQYDEQQWREVFTRGVQGVVDEFTGIEQKFKSITTYDLHSNVFAYSYETPQSGAGGAGLQIQSTFAGEQFVNEIKNFFSVGVLASQKPGLYDKNGIKMPDPQY